MNTSRLLHAAFAALLVGCQSADPTAPAPAQKAAAKAASKAKPAPAQYVFYVGTSGAKAQGVLRCVLDGKTGKISVPTVAAEAKSASYVALSPDAKFLYATAEAAEGAVAAYAVEGDKLRLLNTEASKGKGPTHLAVDAARKNLVVVNYGSGRPPRCPSMPTVPSPPLRLRSSTSARAPTPAVSPARTPTASTSTRRTAAPTSPTSVRTISSSTSSTPRKACSPRTSRSPAASPPAKARATSPSIPTASSPT